MSTPKNRLDIINRKILLAVLDEKATEGSLEEKREALIEILKVALERGTEEVRRRFMEETDKGTTNAKAQCYLMDQILRVLFDFVTHHIYPLANPTTAERLTLVATGGYGRGELAPFSDVDLMFLTPFKATPWAENVAEYMLYILWDLHLKVGYSTRSPKDCITLSRQDLSIRTSMLEARYLWGDRALFAESKKSFVRRVITGSGPKFVEDKLAERDARHIRMGDTRYVVEPNVKEGKGGLRDLQTMWWIAKYLYGVNSISELVPAGMLTRQEYRHFRKAESFLMTVRVAMHYLSARAEERLSFDLQRQISELLRYKDRPGASGVERFMKHYFLIAKQVGDLTRIFCAVLETREQKKPLLARLLPTKKFEDFRLDGDRLNIVGLDDFTTTPLHMLKIFQVANDAGYDIHPQALHAIQQNLSRIDSKLRRDPVANDIFLSLLTAKTTKEDSLRKMNEAGVLGKFIPDFGRIVAQMQYDMYHHYTVDEHTIRAVGLLAKIEARLLIDDHPVASAVVPKVVSRRVLYIAVFLHDIAKGRGGNHSILGAEVAEKLCPRLGLTLAETESVAWLVRNHLLMSHIAFKRDLSDNKTISDFVAVVQSPERLKLLLALTVVDIRAVGPNTWNSWKGQLLRDLYYASEEMLLLGHATIARGERVAQKQTNLRESLNEWPQTETDAHASRFSDAYWIAEEVDVLALNAILMKDTHQAGEVLGVATLVDQTRGLTTVSIFTRDHPGLFAQMSGALSKAGATIIGARVHTTRDGMAIDNFDIQSIDDTADVTEERLIRLKDMIVSALKNPNAATERPSFRQALAQKDAAFHVEPAVIIDNGASNRSTIIEVNAKDRPGLLFDLAEALYRLKLSIFSAHVATYGERAVDVFYVCDLLGKKIENKIRLNNIEKKLLGAVRGETMISHIEEQEAPA